MLFSVFTRHSTASTLDLRATALTLKPLFLR